jgi:hypothetical protein
MEAAAKAGSPAFGGTLRSTTLAYGSPNGCVNPSTLLRACPELVEGTASVSFNLSNVSRFVNNLINSIATEGTENAES